MTYTLQFAIILGSGDTGLTLNAQRYDTSGVNSGTAITTGFAEIGNGHYTLNLSTIPDDFRGGIKFYESGVPGTILASCSINPEEGEYLDASVQTVDDNVDTVVGKLPTNYIMGSSVQTAKDDEIDGIKGVTDNLPDSGALSTIDGNIDSILADTGTDGVVLANNAITSAKIATDAITSDELAASAITEIQSGLATSSELSTHDGKLDTVDSNVDAIVGKLPTNYIMGSSVQTAKDDEIDAILADTDELQTDDIPTTLATLATSSELSTHDGKLDTVDSNVDTVVGKLPTNYIMGSSVQTDKDDEIDAILADTDELQTDDIPTTLATLATSAALSTHDGKLDTVDSNVDTIVGKLPTNYIMGSSVQTDKDDEIDAILADTGTDGVVLADNSITSAKIATNAIGSDEFADTAVDKIIDEIITGSWTLRQLIRLMSAVLFGKSTGGGTNNPKFRNLGDTLDAVDATVDSSGNRTSITLDGS